MTEKIDIHRLGGHFDRQLQTHIEEHEQKAVVEEARRTKLNELRSKINYITTAEGLARRPMTAFYPVEKLDNGTGVAAYLSTDIEGRSIKETAGMLTYQDRVPGSDANYAKDYLLKGPRSKIELEHLDQGEFDRIPKYLMVHAQLETVAGSTKTTKAVFVGAVIDPETLIVPEISPNPENKELHYKFIGPDDSRFGPIMAMVEHVNEGVGPRGERPHVG